VLCAAEVKKDIAGLLKTVPALDDMFSIIDKIGAGNCATVSHISLYISLLILVSITSYLICFEMCSLRIKKFVCYYNCMLDISFSCVQYSS